jgi:aspartate aminotransferase
VAAEAALNGDQGCMAPMLAAFKQRHKLVVDGLNALPGVKCLMAGGAFYAFPDMRGAIKHLHASGKIKAPTDLELSEYLLEQAGVAVVPGSAFGAEGYIRLSFATSNANLENALARMAKALA